MSSPLLSQGLCTDAGDNFGQPATPAVAAASACGRAWAWAAPRSFLSRVLVLLLLLASPALAASSQASATTPAEIWLCGRQPVQWLPGVPVATLTVGADAQTLVPGEPSGLWVAQADTPTRWQLSPDEGQAQLSWRGEAFAACSRAGRPVLPYVAHDESSGAWLRLSDEGVSWFWQGRAGHLEGRPAPQPIPGGWRYPLAAEGQLWQADVLAQPCRRAGDGGPAPHTVIVRQEQGGAAVPGTPVMRGCGGEPAANLLSVGWQATLLRGAPPLASAPIEVRFRADGGLEGHTGCNAFAGAFVLSEAGLRIDQWRRAQRPCQSLALQRQEAELSALLQGVRSFDIDDEGALVLFSTAGTLKAMAQTPWSPAAVAARP